MTELDRLAAAIREYIAEFQVYEGLGSEKASIEIRAFRRVLDLIAIIRSESLPK